MSTVSFILSTVLGACLVYSAAKAKLYPFSSHKLMPQVSPAPRGEQDIATIKRAMESEARDVEPVSGLVKCSTTDTFRATHVREERHKDDKFYYLVKSDPPIVQVGNVEDQAASNIADEAGREKAEVSASSPFPSTNRSPQDVSSVVYEVTNTEEADQGQELIKTSNTSSRPDVDVVSNSSHSTASETGPRTPPDQLMHLDFHTLPTNCSSVISAKTAYASEEVGPSIKPMAVAESRVLTEHNQQRYLSEPIPLHFNRNQINLDTPEWKTFESVSGTSQHSATTPSPISALESNADTLQYVATPSRCGRPRQGDSDRNGETHCADNRTGIGSVMGKIEDPFTNATGRKGEGGGHNGRRMRKLAEAWRDQPSRLSF